MRILNLSEKRVARTSKLYNRLICTALLYANFIFYNHYSKPKQVKTFITKMVFPKIRVKFFLQ